MKKISSRNRILFFNTWPTGDLLKDGYFKRVALIDSILSNFHREYVTLGRPYSQIQKDGRTHTSLPYTKLGIARLLLRAFTAKAIYIHSVLRLESRAARVVIWACRTFLFKTVIFDVHGAVPEEFQSINKDQASASKFTTIESFLLRNCTLCICVSRNMERHLRDKHGIPRRYLVMPMIQTMPTPPINTERIGNRIVYCGGSHEWQQPKLMMEIASRHSDLFEFLFLTNDVNSYETLKKDMHITKAVSIRSVAPSEVYEELSSCTYGFLLREELTLNSVACPTKLIEYIHCGVIPIMATKHVGDFAELGMEYIPVSEMALTRDSGQLKKMRAINLDLLGSMKSNFEINKDELLRILENRDIEEC